MAEQKRTNNNQNSSLVKTLIIAFLILIGAFGTGMIIRIARTDSTEQEQIIQENETNTSHEQQAQEIIYTTIPPLTEIPELPEPVEEIVIEPEPEPVLEETPLYDENTEIEDYYATQRREDARQWISWLSTLTEEERNALFRGSVMSFMQLMQRWQNIPPEQVLQERAFFEELIQGWRDLPPEDRQQGIENIQIQLEEWMQSGQQF